MVVDMIKEERMGRMVVVMIVVKVVDGSSR